MEKFYTYILYSSKIDRFYIGSTNNLPDRLHRHNARQSKSTRSGAPDWAIVYSEVFPSRSLAFRREIYFKKMKSRIFLEKLIANQAPD